MPRTGMEALPGLLGAGTGQYAPLFRRALLNRGTVKSRDLADGACTSIMTGAQRLRSLLISGLVGAYHTCANAAHVNDRVATDGQISKTQQSGAGAAVSNNQTSSLKSDHHRMEGWQCACG